MNAFTVTAPVAGFNGESCSVVFKDGVGHVTDATKESRAAIEYFRRRGYTLTPEGADEAEQDGPQEGTTPPAEQFDPSEHSAEQVLAYLDSTNDEDEIARVLEAEQHGKARKTILQKGADQ
ncbi:hypothetical protein [Streptomyces sp. NPDC005322]|uniref:hypothetical protein n=1 Tax=Streptomyces sp. NPDC005322 TaxID=3157032 RepID=UPI0033BE88CE